MKLILIIGVAVALMLSGCANSGGLIPISDTTINEAGQVVETTIGYTKDVSIAKEQAVLSAHNARTAAALTAYKTEGLKLTWKPVKKTYQFPGMADSVTVTEMMPEISYKAPLVFDQPLPMAPSVHPAWAFATSAWHDTIGLGGKAIMWNYGSDMVKSALDNSGTKYMGDYHPQTAEPFIVEPTVITTP